MSWINALVGIGTFCVVMAGGYWLLQQWVPDARERRLLQLLDQPTSRWQKYRVGLETALTDLLLRLSHWATPQTQEVADAAVMNSTELRLVHAGWREPNAVAIFYGLKTALTVLIPGILLWAWWVVPPAPTGLTKVSSLLACCGLGYYLPDLAIHGLISRRQKHLLHAFPDALDLLRVCVQAGLGLDAAIERVGKDMRITSAAISEEFALTGLELRAGLARSAALKNMSKRMGLKDIEALVSMLIQADRFGSSISESLVVYSEALRTKRRLLAEEAAAKLPVKLLIPLIFCIFPSLLTVLLGPVVISFQQHFHPQAVGG
jgi:tight adherence protein C